MTGEHGHHDLASILPEQLVERQTTPAKHWTGVPQMPTTIKDDGLSLTLWLQT